MKTLALIPARGGSKGILAKNTHALAGRPLIAWTIDAARTARGIDRIIVTTDDATIAAAARREGAEVPFMRPAELARDDTPGIEPVLHALDWMARVEAYLPDLVLLLQPTSPLRTAGDIEAAMLLRGSRDADAVVSVVESPHHPQWMRTIDEHGNLLDLDGAGPPASRRQDLPPTFALNGAIYLVRREVIITQRTLIPKNTLGYVMPRDRSVDIDTPSDLRFAAFLMENKHAK